LQEGDNEKHGRRQDFLQEGANIEAPRGERSGEGVSPSSPD